MAPDEAWTGGPASCRKAPKLETARSTRRRLAGKVQARTLDMSRTKITPRSRDTSYCEAAPVFQHIGTTPDNGHQDGLLARVFRLRPLKMIGRPSMESITYDK